jgi:hypothetical protein
MERMNDYKDITKCGYCKTPYKTKRHKPYCPYTLVDKITILEGNNRKLLERIEELDNKIAILEGMSNVVTDALSATNILLVDKEVINTKELVEKYKSRQASRKELEKELEKGYKLNLESDINVVDNDTMVKL